MRSAPDLEDVKRITRLRHYGYSIDDACEELPKLPRSLIEDIYNVRKLYSDLVNNAERKLGLPITPEPPRKGKRLAYPEVDPSINRSDLTQEQYLADLAARKRANHQAMQATYRSRKTPS